MWYASSSVNPSRRVAIADRTMPSPMSSSTRHVNTPNRILLEFAGCSNERGNTEPTKLLRRAHLAHQFHARAAKSIPLAPDRQTGRLLVLLVNQAHSPPPRSGLQSCPPQTPNLLCSPRL